ncbi:MAG: nucleoside triphosphate pyrophosphohydrolase family protein [Succinivibrio sp.]|nr:nucleoside triphosphate pyrophosphohydrolase family protein [Succinivibrio sp.]
MSGDNGWALHSSGLYGEALKADDYQIMAARTADPDRPFNERLEIALEGLGSETGEVLGVRRAALEHKKELDREALLLEVGDVLWYAAEICSTLGVDLSEVMLRNIDKLKKRWPDGFKV